MADFIAIVFSAIALVLSAITFLVGRRFQNADKRQALSIDLWQRWDTGALREQRIIFWNGLKAMIEDPLDSQEQVDFTELPTDMLRALNDIERFLDALGKLYAAERLDQGLIKDVFAPNIDQWATLSRRVKRDDTQQVKSVDEVAAIHKRLEPLRTFPPSTGAA
ncbi:MAG: hypothetical protein AAGA72_16360 [Pseudomonadota bacterium]